MIRRRLQGVFGPFCAAIDVLQNPSGSGWVSNIWVRASIRRPPEVLRKRISTHVASLHILPRDWPVVILLPVNLSIVVVRWSVAESSGKWSPCSHFRSLWFFSQPSQLVWLTQVRNSSLGCVELSVWSIAIISCSATCNTPCRIHSVHSDRINPW